MIGIKAATVGGVLLIAMASPALAYQCTSLLSKVDATVADASNLSTAQADEIMTLRGLGTPAGEEPSDRLILPRFIARTGGGVHCMCQPLRRDSV